MDKPTIAPDTRTPRHSPDSQPLTPSQPSTPPPSGTITPKRKEQSQPFTMDSNRESGSKHRRDWSSMVVEVGYSNGRNDPSLGDFFDAGEMLARISHLEAKVHHQRNEKEDLLSKFRKEERRREAADTVLLHVQRRYEHENAAWEDRFRAVERDRQVDRVLREQAQATLEFRQADLEHLEDINTTLKADIDELRAVENEAATRRNDAHLGLPPAYGNLDDEQHFPPYSAHDDGGTIEVAHLKRELRQRFEIIVNKALNNREDRSSLVMLSTLTSGLYEACNRLQRLLELAPQVSVGYVQKPQDYGGYIELHMRSLSDSIRLDAPDLLPGIDKIEAFNRIKRKKPDPYLPGYTIMQRENGAPYVADRIAKLLLELLWRSAATCEVRPGLGNPDAERSSALVSSIMLQFEQIDRVLTATLQLAFSRKSSLVSLQHYLTQFERIATLLKAQSYGRANQPFFGKACEWLNEQIETERMLAFRAAQPEIFRDGDDDDDDGVSSRWQGSDAGSGGDENDENNDEDDQGEN